MVNDSYTYYQCRTRYTTQEEMEEILTIVNDVTQQQNVLTYLHILLNIFGLFNIVLVFIVFGRPWLITITICLSAICIRIALLIENVQYMIYLEISAIVVSTIITFRSLHSISILMFEIIVKKLKKTRMNARVF